MQAMKEKAKDMASAVKEHVDTYKAKAEEKAAKATAKTEGQKVAAHEVRKAKEAEANRDLHEAKARHRMEGENAKHAQAMAATGGNDMLIATHDHHGGHIPDDMIPATAAAAGAAPTDPISGHLSYPTASKYL